MNAWAQVTDAVTSAGANLEEAEAGSSRRDFVAKSRIALRELRETDYWLRIIKAARLGGSESVGPLLPEARELVAIVTTIVKNASNNDER